MKRVTVLILFAATCTLLTVPGRVSAQTLSYLSDDEIRMLSNEISGDRAFEHIRWLTHWHRDSGTEGFFKAADYVMQAAAEAGLEDVRFVEQPLTRPSYDARSAELWLTQPVTVKLADIGDHALYLADGSHDADITAELVWIGDGSKEALKDLDVAGKIVLTSGRPQTAVQNAVWDKGALGVVCYPTSEGKSPMDFPDQIAWTRITLTPPPGKEATFAFTLPPRKGDTLRKLLTTEGLQDFFATGQRTKGGRAVVKAKVDTEISPGPGRTGFVEGWIRGTKYHDQQIVLTAHLQEEQGSANDDGSGCANLLELARTFAKLIREGRVQRPLRDLRFWWTDEIYSEYRYFADHPEEPKKFLANVHQDMTGARQSLGSRVQHLIFAPHSRTSYLDALFEDAGTYLLQTNNSYLAAGRQGGLPRPHSRPIYSSRGTREGYNARFVPHFGSSDHMCFVDGAIGVPAVALINWDDDFIHSSDDDLDKIDQTQLQRNDFLIASLAYFLGFRAEAKDVPLLAMETLSQGQRRLANDFTVAMRVLKDATPGSGDDAWKKANIVIEQGVKRELRALNSIRVFAGADPTATALIDQIVGREKEKQAQLTADLSAFARQIHGSSPEPIQLTAEEMEADRKVPVNVAPLKDYLDARRGINDPGSLHGLMRTEVFNFVDGNRSYYDIYKAVAAEAMDAGSWYYGTVNLSDVVALLDAGVEAKALALK